jgi:hypothetical protein
MRFDRPLSVGATGGHGPIRYSVESYEPGQSIRFRFQGPKGFDGFHGYELLSEGDGVILRHRLEMETHGLAIITWPVLFGPLHDALLEDSLGRAEASLRLTPSVRPWSPWVRLLRWVLTGGRARKQRAPAMDVYPGSGMRGPEVRQTDGV